MEATKTLTEEMEGNHATSAIDQSRKAVKTRSKGKDICKKNIITKYVYIYILYITKDTCKNARKLQKNKEFPMEL